MLLFQSIFILSDNSDTIEERIKIMILRLLENNFFYNHSHTEGILSVIDTFYIIIILICKHMKGV